MRIRHSVESHSPSRRVSAFTLAELLVAMVIIGLVVGALYAGISWGFRTVRWAREDLRATQILVEMTEAIRLYNFDQINDPNFIAPTFTKPYDTTTTNTSSGLVYQGTVTVSPFTNALSYADDLRQVTVRVTWTSEKMQRNREISTYVCRTGLQIYLY